MGSSGIERNILIRLLKRVGKKYIAHHPVSAAMAACKPECQLKLEKE
jgi:hypothetical protein